MTVSETRTPRHLRSALFVDFDNVYIGLTRLDAEAAEAFATDPGHWLAELAHGSGTDGEITRRFLVLACYLNPSVYSRYRPNFTRAGFQVVDCPSLTQQGKSSADINLVLDAVDALAARTRYDEFVIVSADADFTPLAQRCRADDRRVTIITASPAASAYRAVADQVIGADALADLVSPSVTPLDQPPVAPVVVPPAAAPAARTAELPAQRSTEPEPDVAAVLATSDARARKAVLRTVRRADRPMTLGAVAQVALDADPALGGTGWAGAGGFAAWLARAVPEVAVSTRPPGHVWDPQRFGEADLPGAVADADPTALQRQVIAVTDTPGLSQRHYRVLLETLAKDVAAHAFDRQATTRRVYEACQSAGAMVGRSTVNFVLSGVLYTGLSLDARPGVGPIASAWADNVVGLCRGARMDLTAGDVTAIRTWVTGGLLD
ncbi:NYN domain-containing protein [Cellulomonas oligotrophica]|uniref:NYN domain-containing protein n=1 Tax=Cellulomonas oligotrophica TaxID=931536 RepID=A0A7Y9K118_9CELL|nr:NYN domain-containing protein [Cellulomonas oligotrophica]NYD87890.1 hypothetical protein [Cellulomonas oligotrophica]GIG32903.1 NYN domain-containing protein [Cellulomonas oligotrophica]